MSDRFFFSRGNGVLGPRYTRYTPVGSASDLNDEAMGWAPRMRCEFFEDFTGPQPTVAQSEAMFSAGGAANQIAVGAGTTTIATFRVTRGGTLSGARMTAEDALATSDTNFLTFTLVNTGQSGAGTTAMLAATDANTTKATGGVAITAVTGRAFTLHGTAANLRVAAGDVLVLTATVTGTLANVVDLPVGHLTFSTLPNTVVARTTKTVGLIGAAPVANAANGEVSLALTTTAEAQVVGLDWGDQLAIPANARPIFQCRLKYSGAVAGVRWVAGLADAYNATFDTVANNAWFRIEGASLNLLAEIDDSTTNDDDNDSLFDLVADTYVLLTIDMTELGRILFSVNDTRYLELAGAAFAAADLLQPVIWLQSDAGGASTDKTLVVDFLRVSWDRAA